jgi:hypothetical protein
MSPSTAAATVALVLGTVASVRGAEPVAAPPPNYAAVMVGTTAVYRPPGGPWTGLQSDVTPMVGYGRYVTKTVALELDLGPTFVKGRYASFGLVPAVVWSFSSHAYLAARFLVPLDPETNFGVFPGVGVFRSYGRYSPYVEVNLASYVGRGDPDLAVSVTAGVLIAF